MIYQILNGDSLSHHFSKAEIPGEIVVMREAFIEGSLKGDTLAELWKTRAEFRGLPSQEYQDTVVKEIEKIQMAPDHSEFNLWFEYDLFCQVNLWFLISVISGLPIGKNVFIVYTSHLNRNDRQFWNGFGSAGSHELNICYSRRIRLDESDLALGVDLWNAFKKDDLEKLKQLSKSKKGAFPYISEAIQAHIDRFPRNGEKGRPEKVLEEILKNTGADDFQEVFKEFWKRESIYGFGDTQLKRLYDKIRRGETSA